MQYTDDELCDCLRQLADQLGETPTALQCKEADITPGSRTYQRRFGSWNAALEAAGLSINEEGPSYTDAELIDSLQEFADGLDGSPTSIQVKEASQMPSERVYEDRFGSWNAALKAAGLSVNQKRSYSDDELTTALSEFANAHGETPTHAHVEQSSKMPGTSVYCDHFETWNTALEAAGLDINRESSFTNEELLAILQECATELGHTPSALELDNRTDLPSANTYMSRFDSWNAALRAAGLTPNHEPEPYDGTDKELLEMLRELDAEMDTSPTRDDVKYEPELPSSAVFAHRFGGWNEAKRKAGLATHEQPTQYTETELIQELQRVAHELGKTPTRAEMKNTDAPSPSTYQRRFESWSNAHEEAGLDMNRAFTTD